MKRAAIPRKGQLNLLLLNNPVTMVASSAEQKELTVALVELHHHAAQGHLEMQPDGGDNEPFETHA